MNSFSAAFNWLSERRLSWRCLEVQWWSLTCIGLCLALFALPATAQTQAGGVIATDTVWHTAQSPYIVTSDILIQNGAILTIEAGTTVYMGMDTRFTMQSGTLKAIGTAQAPIKITSQKLQNNQTAVPGDWQQLTFEPGINNATRLEHVYIEYGKGIVINGAAPTLNYLNIKNNQGPAIAADLAASPTGVGNQASNNAINAIVVPAGDVSGPITWGIRGIPYLVQSGTISVGASPKVNTVTPNILQQAEKQTITLTGFRLSGLSQPTFDLPGLSAQILAGATDIQAQVEVTATSGAALGSANFMAQADAGEVKIAGALTIVATQPKLASVMPSTLSVGQGDATVLLKGQNFTNQSVAYLDNSALATTYINSNEISAVVPNQTANSTKSIRLRTPNAVSGGPEYVSNDLTITVVTPPPVIATITPDTLRRGETKTFQINGTGLNTISITTPDPALSVSNLTLAPTQASFNLTAGSNASLGKQQLTLTNAGGSTSVALTVNPALPKASVAPTPIAVPPDGSSRQFAVQLSFADTVGHTFSVTIADPTIVSTSSSSLTIAAGQLQVIGSIVGKKAGVTSLTLTSDTLGTISVPIYVTSDFLGLNTSTAPLLGVILTPPPSPGTTQPISPASRHLGVVFGNVIQELMPKAFSIDSGTSTLTISGIGLQAATSIAVKPADGITIGAIAVAADGKSVNVPLTISADAPTTPRQVILSSASGPYPVAKPDTDRILITLPRPEVWSLDPLFTTAGVPNLNMVIRGRNLQSTQSISITPPDGIAFGESPTVSADGTQINAVMNIASSAALGPRVITVNTPAGSSDSAASASNTFTIVNSVNSTITPIVSPALGIVKEDVPTPTPAQTQSVVARVLGVTLGAAATGMNPQSKAIGETFTLTVRGIGLGGVTGVSFAPATGITVGTPTIAADGRSLTAEVSIALDAPQTTRALQLSAGAARILFVQPAAAVFTVTAQQPVITTTDPIVLQLGAAPVTMTIRGQNFQNAQAVRFMPPDGITVTAPPIVDAAATQLTVSVSASSGATPGKRAVIVTTPGGESSADLTVANTVTLANSTVPAGPVAAPLLGIVKQDTAPPPSLSVGPVASANLGVVYEVATNPQSSSHFMISGPLGITFGPATTAIEPQTLAVGSSGLLTITGAALDTVSGISINPPEGITIGTPLQIAADGRQVTVPVSIASDAAKTTRQVIVTDTSGKIAFTKAAASLLQITADAPLPLSSISPILSTQGSLLNLTIRGQNLHKATAVTASPATGLMFDNQPVVNSEGTELTIRLQIAADAPLGSRVIQVITPVASSSTEPSAANTFTVYAP